MLDDAKVYLRINNTAFDIEIIDLIDACKSDLALSGIKSDKINDNTDPLIRRAVFIYVKAYFGWDNSDQEKLINAYRMIKMHLTMSDEYTVVE